MKYVDKSPLFETGTIRITDSIRNLIKSRPKYATSIENCFVRHSCGDWGNISDYDKNLNNRSIIDEKLGIKTNRIFSQYHIGSQTIWIITERDRSSTTILIPDDY